MRLINILFFIVITLPIFTYANSSVEVKLELSNTVCSFNSTVAYFDLFIKKSDHVSGNLKLQNQNYRLSFDANSLEFDSFFIEAEGAVSSFGVNSDQSIYLFGGHTLTGTTEHIVSYNIDLQGGGGIEVSHDWVLIGTIGATLKTNSECFSSVYLKDSDFPSTTLIYSIDGGDRIIDANPLAYNVDDCIITYCNSCNQNLDLNTLEHNYLNGEILDYKVQDYINASNVIGSNAEITYDVTNKALLKSGFEVQRDAVFEVKIGGCQ